MFQTDHFGHKPLCAASGSRMPVLTDLLWAVLLLTGAVSGHSTLVYDVTTMAANYSECFCPCDEVEALANTSSPSAPATQQEAQAAAQQLVSELRLNAHNLSSATRRKTSAPDDRPSAKGIGTVGVAVIVAVVLCVVAMDVGVLCRDLATAFRRLTSGRCGHRHARRRGASRDLGGKDSAAKCVAHPGSGDLSSDLRARGCPNGEADRFEELPRDFRNDGRSDNRRAVEEKSCHGLTGTKAGVPYRVQDIKRRREMLEMNLTAE